MSMTSAELVVGTKIRVLKGTHNGKEGLISRDATNNKRWVFFRCTNGKEERTSIQNIELIHCGSAASASFLYQGADDISRSSSVEYHSACCTPPIREFDRLAENQVPSAPKLIRCITPDSKGTSKSDEHTGWPFYHPQHATMENMDQGTLIEQSEIVENAGNIGIINRNTSPFDFAMSIKEIVLEPKLGLASKKTLASLIFKSPPLVYSINSTKLQACAAHFPKSTSTNGKVYGLLTLKMHENGSLPWGKTYNAKFHYYMVNSGELLQEKLEAIANFANETPQKAKSRLEILESPGDTPYDGKQLYDKDFEIIDDDHHDGHGYIPRKYLDRFLGTGKPAGRTRDIQVRLCGPRIGLFKGNLIEKQGIDKIQLRKNMCKVSPSLTCSDDWVSLVITQKYPSTNSWYMGRYLNSHKPEVKPPPETFKKDVKNGKFVPKPDIINVWKACNIPSSICESYKERCRTLDGLKNANVVGVPDPTGFIPPGYIFVPGMGIEEGKHTLFVTRFPCLEPSDALLLPMVTTKPHNMPDADWQFLNDFPFGFLMFGPPAEEGGKPIAQTIADGDEDGDLYFICWDEQILSLFSPMDNGVDEICQVDLCTTYHVDAQQQHTSWLDNVQCLLLDADRIILQKKLISKLHAESKKIAEKSPNGINDKDARQLARACKLAIDLGKHGGKIQMPSHLRDCFPKFSQFLC